ncbi:YncE family protein [Methyloceanibacter sp.]|uniref:YncE family protein n=1 Tax=Methyloceanibacter sp. TaxID=1965321 RepID=UPI003D9B8425
MLIDLTRRAALAVLAAGAALPLRGTAMAQPMPVGAGRLYVTSWFGAAISVVDLARGEAVKTIPVGVHDHNVFLSPDRSAAWVANNNDGTVTIIDTASDEVRAVLPLGAGPRHTFYSPDGANAYVTLEFEDAVAEVDAVSHTARRRLAVGHMPHF